MSVYTVVEHAQLEDFLRHYDVGRLISFQGIGAGIENTNYFVTTSTGEFVLTLFERLNYEEVLYFLELMAYLADRGVPSAHPLADQQEHYLQILNNKPAALVERLAGQDLSKPTSSHCYALGNALGYLHSISPSFPYRRPNGRGPHWWKITAEQVLPFLTQEESSLLQEELHFQMQHRHLDLPRGVIHGDLFRDNVLFSEENLRGIIDFYYACDDVLLYDVAVAVNDWCRLTESSQLDESLMHSFLEGYSQQRKLTRLEYQVWPVMLRAAALRFWLSRLQDLHFPRLGEMTHIKNPDDFKDILQAHQQRYFKVL